ncbi:unnamed protein product [Candida verbasci]|uniref:chitinase n=1 Tax=Candida verbasci TaxID=1227364 RepID=A0A9W4TRH4_9ASCO|nr:unnamed protein product [Candida verbasci]
MIFLLFLIPFSYCSIAAYWGQNAGGNQGSLASYCQSNSADIIILSFLNDFPKIGLNFANACSDTFSDGLLHCPQIGQDIKTCQQQGKIILLSLGGATGNYGFSSDSDAASFAETLWNKFLESSDSERPFDDAIVDGFDFDIENKQQTGYVALANSLKSYFAKGSKKYYLSASPQCPYPDESVGDLMSSVDLDFAFIQFYNNYCSLDKQFNWDTWANYANGKNIKLFLGLPGSPSSAGSGYVDISKVQRVIPTIKSGKNFGGVSLWDISSTPVDFLDGIKDALGGSAQPASTYSQSSATSSYIPQTPSTVYSQYISTTQQSQPTHSITTITQSTTSSNNFFDWLFGSPSITAAQAAASTTAQAAAPTTASSFNWWGIFERTTSSTTLQTIYQTIPTQAAADATTYVTLTTTVYAQAQQTLLQKRDNNIREESNGVTFKPNYLLLFLMYFI